MTPVPRAARHSFARIRAREASSNGSPPAKPPCFSPGRASLGAFALALTLAVPAAGDVFVGAGRPPSTFQAEPSIAVDGDVIVIGFNDKGFDSPVQRVLSARSGYAFSLDRGATWTHRSELPVGGDGAETGGDPRELDGVGYPPVSVNSGFCVAGRRPRSARPSPGTSCWR